MTRLRNNVVAPGPIPQIRLYTDWLKDTRGQTFGSYAELHGWSVEDPEGFWRSIWDYEGIASPTKPTAILSTDAMPNARWFEGAQVNYAQHVFSHTAAAEAAGQPAIVAMDERGQIMRIGWAELRRQVASLALALRERGVAPGDRVAAYLPNIPAAVIGLLACAAIGAVWTLCSPDMGTNAVLDRWRQTQPKVLIAVDGVFYAGKAMDRSAAVAAIREQLPAIEVVFLIATGMGDQALAGTIDFAGATAGDDAAVADFTPEWLPFDHPLWILYSSGTTGLPKAIVHGHGGVLLATAAGRMGSPTRSCHQGNLPPFSSAMLLRLAEPRLWSFARDAIVRTSCFGRTSGFQACTRNEACRFRRIADDRLQPAWRGSPRPEGEATCV
ncbi:AMP-binding protein [Sphingopyxis sp. LK2115]|uniref:AMP-binding protein n=1 Tax=Sphingopyxis sp. LK2115 TaxID=2744558 RepID=UPI0016616E92|nr:AMP-binding protein [Sphingopyxis sp. LK2115]